jgi:formylglycine-generating enzyme required for sulfatase activity
VVCVSLGACGQVDSGEEPFTTTTVVTDSGVEMVLIPGGWFPMGSDEGPEDQGPVHRVWVDTFLMDKYEVTQDQYARFQMSDPSRFQGGRLPVEQRTWIDAIRFCNERSYQEGLEPCYDEETLECDFDANGYRLPTEAEWEYATRAGTETRFFWGDAPSSLRQHAWTEANSAEKTHQVGTRRPNPWGLHDLYGNVAEWVHDYYASDYYSLSPERNPRGPREGEFRVLRGGAWDSRPDAMGSARRAYSASVDDGCLVSDAVGFRCVRPPLPSELGQGSEEPGS